MFYVVLNAVLSVFNTAVAFQNDSMFCMWVGGFAGGMSCGLLLELLNNYIKQRPEKEGHLHEQASQSPSLSLHPGQGPRLRPAQRHPKPEPPKNRVIKEGTQPNKPAK